MLPYAGPYPIDEFVHEGNIDGVKTKRPGTVREMKSFATKLVTNGRQFISETLTQFQSGRIGLQEATDLLLAEQTQRRARKSASNQRLKSLCGTLQRGGSPAKVQKLKQRLSHEFYYGDEVA